MDCVNNFRVCHTTVVNQSTILSVFKLTNLQSKEGKLFRVLKIPSSQGKTGFWLSKLPLCFFQKVFFLCMSSVSSPLNNYLPITDDCLWCVRFLLSPGYSVNKGRYVIVKFVILVGLRLSTKQGQHSSFCFCTMVAIWSAVPSLHHHVFIAMIYCTIHEQVKLLPDRRLVFTLFSSDILL